jgi:hypothetical protein
MFSIYVSAFNLIQHGFNWEPHLENFSNFAGLDGEVVVAVNTSTDDTFDVLSCKAALLGNVKVIQTDFSYGSITMDGDIKNAALQACTKEICIQMDFDEGFVQAQRTTWAIYAEQMLASPHLDCLLIPSIDLYNSISQIRADKPIGFKYRMHKKGFLRGVRKDAWLGNGKIDTSMSDTCELLNPDGSLVRKVALISPIEILADANRCAELNDYIYTLHFGYLDLDQRVNINKKIWASHWEMRSGKKENVVVERKELDNVPLVNHNLLF